MSNLADVQRIYEAFGRGDVPTILEHLDEHVEWEYGAVPSDVPWLQRREGRAGAADFFSSLAGLEIERFEPKAFFESEGLMVVVLDLEGRVPSTGIRIHEEDEVHLWHFNDQGKVTRFRHRADTLQHQRAWRGESV